MSLARWQGAPITHEGGPDVVYYLTGRYAGHVARTGRFKGSGGGAGIQLLRRLATARGADEADLLSYILFDGLYAAEVARLGYEDARNHHDELAKFLADAVVRE